jgi:hypothetical protein
MKQNKEISCNFFNWAGLQDGGGRDGEGYVTNVKYNAFVIV